MVQERLPPGLFFDIAFADLWLALSGYHSGRGHHGVFAYAVALVLDTDMAAGPTCDSLDTCGNGRGGFEMRAVLLRPATQSCVHFPMIPSTRR